MITDDQIVNDALNFKHHYFFEQLSTKQCITGEEKPHELERVYIIRARSKEDKLEKGTKVFFEKNKTKIKGTIAKINKIDKKADIKGENQTWSNIDFNELTINEPEYELNLTNFIVMPMFSHSEIELRYEEAVEDEHGMKHPVLSCKISKLVLSEQMFFLWNKAKDNSSSTQQEFKKLEDGLVKERKKETKKDNYEFSDVFVEFAKHELYSMKKRMIYDRLKKLIDDILPYVSKDGLIHISNLSLLVSEMVDKIQFFAFIESTDLENRQARTQLEPYNEQSEDIRLGTLGNENPYRIIKYTYLHASDEERTLIMNRFKQICPPKGLHKRSIGIQNLFGIHKFYLKVELLDNQLLPPVDIKKTAVHWQIEVPDGLRIIEDKVRRSDKKDWRVDKEPYTVVEGGTFILQFPPKYMEDIIEQKQRERQNKISSPREKSIDLEEVNLLFQIPCKEHTTIAALSWIPVIIAILFASVIFLLYSPLFYIFQAGPSEVSIFEDLLIGTMSIVVTIALAIGIITIYQYELRQPIAYRFLISLTIMSVAVLSVFVHPVLVFIFVGQIIGGYSYYSRISKARSKLEPT